MASLSGKKRKKSEKNKEKTLKFTFKIHSRFVVFITLMWSSEAVLVLYFPTAVWLDFQNTVPHKLKGA